MLKRDIRDEHGGPWREKTGRHRTFEKELEDGGRDNSTIDTAAINPSAGPNSTRLSLDRRGKVVRRTSIEIFGIDAGNEVLVEPDGYGRHVKRECYKCLHIDVANPDGSPGEFLSFPPYSAPGGLREILFPSESESVASPTSISSAKHEKDVAHLPSDTSDIIQLEESSSSLQVLESTTDVVHLPSDASDMDQLEESSSSLQVLESTTDVAHLPSNTSDMDQLWESSSSLQVLESATDYLMRKVRRLGVIAGASVLRFGDLSVYEEAHFATGHELNDCADLTHLGGCGCFEEQKRLHQLRLDALETDTSSRGNRADSNSDSDSTATASARQKLEPER